MQPTILNFIVEAFNRIRTKSPKFFFVLQMLGVIMTVIGFVPWGLNRWTNIEPSEHFINFCKDISKFSLGFLSSALFAVKTPMVAQTEEGEAVKVTDEKKMPFTAKSEAKEIDKAEPATPVIDITTENKPDT